jgi:hypothetical protein
MDRPGSDKHDSTSESTTTSNPQLSDKPTTEKQTQDSKKPGEALPAETDPDAAPAEKELYMESQLGDLADRLGAMRVKQLKEDLEAQLRELADQQENWWLECEKREEAHEKQRDELEAMRLEREKREEAHEKQQEIEERRYRETQEVLARHERMLGDMLRPVVEGRIQAVQPLLRQLERKDG